MLIVLETTLQGKKIPNTVSTNIYLRILYELQQYVGKSCRVWCRILTESCIMVNKNWIGHFQLKLKFKR